MGFPVFDILFMNNNDLKQGSLRLWATFSLAQTSNPEEPTTFREATTHPTRAKEWEKAIMDEYNSIMRNNKLPRRLISRCIFIYSDTKDELH
jgi:hypothetical protein